MSEIEKYFINKGMVNPKRSLILMKKIINFLDLDLNNLIVFTEAASGEFIYTPIIAAMAGAKRVYAIAKDSDYGLKEDVKEDTMLFARLCNVEDKIEVVYDKEKINEAHIVTNLGFVRPIDKSTINRMRKDAVIPYMCEAWEVRPGDVDIAYCKEKGIKVMGTNENYPGVGVFNYSGHLMLKMLFEAGLEVYKNKVVVVSNDSFGEVIYKCLFDSGADVTLLKDLNRENINCIKDSDALVIADYTSGQKFLHKKHPILTGQKLKELSPFITVIQFAGLVDIYELDRHNIEYYPRKIVGSFRMGKTLAYLGPKPIIDLHCAGLKVGEMMYKNQTKLRDENTLYQYILNEKE